MIKLLLADDHQIVLDGLKSLLKDVAHLKVVGESLNGVAALGQVPLVQPDVVLLDIGMPILDGIETAIRLKNQYPHIKILICTTYSDAHKVKKCLQAGVDGYLLKGSGRATLLDAIEQVMQGTTYYDEKIVKVVMESFNKKRKGQNVELTKREIEIVRLIAKGKSTKEIAEEFFLSPRTVETHRKNIFSKLGINKVAALIRYAIEQELLD